MELPRVKQFLVVINKPNDMNGCVPFDCDAIGTALNALYPFWCLIKHDTDVDDEGIPKMEHIHAIVYRNTRCRYTSVLNELSKWLNYPKNCIQVEECECLNKSIRYLIHLDNPEKAPYMDFEILSNKRSVVDNALKTQYDGVTYEQLFDLCVRYKSVALIIKDLGLDAYNKYWRIIDKLLVSQEVLNARRSRGL